jgi:cephalosporin hydroxylase
MWILQEILAETRPDVLVETGTFKGGSALYFASLFDLIGRGRVYTIDIEDHPGRPAHPRIMFRNGSSTADATVAWIRSQTKAGERVMVALDRAHTKKHVLTELDMYAPLVTPGMYLVVEDSNIGHTFAMGSPEYRDGGPWDAIAEWLPKHPEFERDAAREKFGVTFNPGGWLRRVR